MEEETNESPRIMKLTPTGRASGLTLITNSFTSRIKKGCLYILKLFKARYEDDHIFSVKQSYVVEITANNLYIHFYTPDLKRMDAPDRNYHRCTANNIQLFFSHTT
jgi:hypothetical protein